MSRVVGEKNLSSNIVDCTKISASERAITPPFWRDRADSAKAIEAKEWQTLTFSCSRQGGSAKVQERSTVFWEIMQLPAKANEGKMKNREIRGEVFSDIIGEDSL